MYHLTTCQFPTLHQRLSDHRYSKKGVVGTAVPMPLCLSGADQSFTCIFSNVSLQDLGTFQVSV